MYPVNGPAMRGSAAVRKRARAQHPSSEFAMPSQMQP
jgi:hypothetical protein